MSKAHAAQFACFGFLFAGMLTHSDKISPFVPMTLLVAAILMGIWALILLQRARDAKSSQQGSIEP